MANTADSTIVRGWSISAIARELGLHRPTISTRINEAEIKPCGTVRGRAVYALRDAIPVVADLLGAPRRWGDQQDPEQMTPKDRKDGYDGEKMRRALAREAGELVKSNKGVGDK